MKNSASPTYFIEPLPGSNPDSYQSARGGKGPRSPRGGKWSNKQGFTIVELLIVIVVVGILAAISIVTYTGISGRNHDSAVQSDLRNIGQKFMLYHAQNGLWPVGTTQIAATGIKVSKESYGHHHISGAGAYNMLYCRNNNGQGEIALVGSSRSGKMYKYTKGQVSEFTANWSDSTTTCNVAGAPIPDWNHRDWLYDVGVWKSFL